LANANSTGSCIFYSAPLSGSFTKNNCTAGGTGSSVPYSQVYGAAYSNSSQAEADSNGLVKFNTDGLANANAYGSCTFYSAALSGSLIKSNCASGGAGSSVPYSQAYGAAYSNSSQAEADSNGFVKFNTDGLANANANGYCTFYSAARSGSFTKNNCAAGGTGSSVPYSQAYGAAYSNSSQAEADSNGLAKFNTDGLANANANGYCTFYSAPLSGSFTKNNCAAGGSGSSVPYSQAYGAAYSNSSQAEADSNGLVKFNTDGLANANAYGSCTFYSAALSGSLIKSNCASGGAGSSVPYSQAYGAAYSNSSQAEADSNGFVKFNTDGLANANANGYCTFYSAARSGSFTKNNCAAGGTGSSVPYSQAYGAAYSNSSQAEADSNGLAKFNADGLANANAYGSCTFYSAPLSGSFTKNNCAAGGTGSSVPYSQAYGAEYSYYSQADADSKAWTLFNTNGQANANANGYCTFYSIAYSYNFTKNNCPEGGVGSNHLYNQGAGVEISNVSQEDANYKGLMRFYTDGQVYANANGYCTFYSAALSGHFTKNSCPEGTINASAAFYFIQSAGTIISNISQADADAQALTKFNIEGQAYANAAGECLYYSKPISGTFTKSNCPAGGVGSSIVYSLPYGASKSPISQAQADADALTTLNYNGQAQVYYGGTCTYYSTELNFQYTKDNCPDFTRGSTVYYYIPYGKYQSNISQNDADNKAFADNAANGQNYANDCGYCLRPGEEEN
jgi:20S proteasome alpha/beta subunit